LNWLKKNNIKHLGIHFDLDVLDPSIFSSVLHAKYAKEDIGSPSGKMNFSQVTRLIQDVSNQTNEVELGVTEHLPRSEEHTSELQSRFDLVCRLLLEKKKKHKETQKTEKK